MSMWSLRWHFTNKSVTGASYSIKGYSYRLSHSRTLWWRVRWLKQCRLEVAAELQQRWRRTNRRRKSIPRSINRLLSKWSKVTADLVTTNTAATCTITGPTITTKIAAVLRSKGRIAAAVYRLRLRILIARRIFPMLHNGRGRAL